MLNADFHIHTHYSKCSNMKPLDIVRTAVSRGYDVIGVVDHNSIRGGLEVKKIAGRKLLVIPGEEIMTEDGEVIVFLSDGKYNRNLVEICERAKSMNHYVVFPHPFDYLRLSVLGNINKIKNIDAIEVFNSRVFLDSFNKMAEEYAQKRGIPKVAASDSHFLEEIGNVKCSLDCERSIDSVFECIKKGNIRFSVKKSGIMMHVRSTARIL
ncbi:MAG: PHP domain-containing protein [Candidatus Aenigmatarchaeota archaeon]